MHQSSIFLLFSKVYGHLTPTFDFQTLQSLVSQFSCDNSANQPLFFTQSVSLSLWMQIRMTIFLFSRGKCVLRCKLDYSWKDFP